jgi:hypothetical protein
MVKLQEAEYVLKRILGFMRTSGICRVAGRPARRCSVPTPI